MKLYCDGGCIKYNPSTIGGTWAWCLISDQDKMEKYNSGIITPKDLGIVKIGNNLAELYAAYQGLLAMGENWEGTIHTDSQVTWFRITNSHSFSGIPTQLMEDVLNLRKRMKYKAVLVAGHPRKKELQQGYRHRNGLPTSIWNVWCDETCTKESKKLMKSNKTT